MKKLIIILALGIIGCSASEQETTTSTTSDNCVCYKVYYDYKPVSYQGGSWTWEYVETSKELFSTGGTCNETNYIRISGGHWYKIECR